MFESSVSRYVIGFALRHRFRGTKRHRTRASEMQKAAMQMHRGLVM